MVDLKSQLFGKDTDQPSKTKAGSWLAQLAAIATILFPGQLTALQGAVAEPDPTTTLGKAVMVLGVLGFGQIVNGFRDKG